MKIAAIYARVSGERQRNDNTIASQTSPDRLRRGPRDTASRPT